MSSLRILTGLSSAVRQRLIVSGVTTRNYNWSASYLLSKQFHNHSSHSNSNRIFINDHASFHSSSSKNRTTEAHIDQSLHRLDTEIRRIGRIRRHEVDEILGDIKEMKKATSSQSLMIIRCCGELIPEEPPSRRTELVQQVWKTLETLKVPMDVSHYNALLRVYLENEYKFNPTEFLQDLTSKGIEPNRVTYQRLIARFCQDGDIDGASTILQHMKDKQMPINEYVFNSLILGHGQSNDMESAEGILGVMRQAGLEPNDDTYVTLMTCYAKNGDMENIHRIVKECEEKEIFLIDRDFLNVIYCLAENNHNELIDQILPYLKKHAGYNQEVTNLIFRLTNIGKEELGMKLLKQMVPIIRDGEPVPSGSFFVKHLVQLGRPSDVVIKYCKQLQEEGLNRWALTRAGEFALVGQRYDLAVDIIEAMHDCGFPIRQHYFWPLLAAAKSEDEIHSALRFMRGMRLTPNTETLRDYVIPNVLEKTRDSVEKALHRLSSVTGVALGNISGAAMLHVLNRGDNKLAVQFASTYRIRFGNPLLRKAIVDSYINTKDASTFVQIIGSSVLDGGDDAARENVGMMLMELVESTRSNDAKVALLHPVLKELLNNGLGLSNSGSELLQNNLGEALTPDLANTILQLTSSELTPKISLLSPDSTKRQGQAGGYLDEKSSSELEEILAEAQRKNGNVKSIKKALLYTYSRERQAEKLVKLKEEMDKDDFVYTPGLQALFLEAFCHGEMLKEAREAYEALQKSLDFVMDDLKILRYAFFLQSKGHLDECIQVLKNTGRDETRKPQGAQQQALVWKLLNSLAEKGDPSKVKEVFNILNERNLTPVNAVTLGPIIKSYLVKDDLAGALEEFEKLAEEHRVTPWRQELFCRFIKLEDADRLQKVMDLSTNIHGEVNSMYDLVFAFIDCGKLRQAKKILETPGLRARNDKIEMYCQRYFQENRVGELENLIQVTKDLMDVDRNTMYFYLLQAYCKQGDPDKALSVWTSMQEENVQPSAELLIYLADFLQKNNHPVPFVIPDQSEVRTAEELEALSSELPERTRRGGAGLGAVSSTLGLPRSIVEFRSCIDLNDIDKALQIKQRLESEGSSLNIQDKSLLIEKLSRAERLNEAMKLTEQMLDEGVHPHPRTFRFLLARLGNAADVNALERLQERLSTELKRRITFNSRLCTAYVNAGRGVEFYEKNIKPVVQSAVAEDDTSSSSSSDDEAAVEDQDEVGKVPVFGCVGLLMKNENLVPEMKKLASEANPVHRRGLNNALWVYHMLKRDFAVANDIWEALKNEDRILFRKVMFEARANKDPEMAQHLASQIQSSEGITGKAKATAISCALDVLGECNQTSEAIKLLTESLGKVNIEDYPRSILRRLKGRAEAANLQFPVEIPDSPEASQTRRRNQEARAS